MIKQLDDDGIESISILHEELLPESIFAIFGKEFLSKYFYKEVIKNENLFCDIYEFNRKIIGFITYTNDSPHIFIRQIKNHPFLISFILIKVIFKRASRLKFILSSINFLFKQQKKILPDISSEILSFAVLPEYRVHNYDKATGTIRDTNFYKQSGIKVGEELFNRMITNLKRLNCKRLKIMTPADNISSNLFYKKMGCELTSIKNRIFGLDINVYVKKLN